MFSLKYNLVNDVVLISKISLTCSRGSDLSHWGLLGALWVWQWVVHASGRQVHDRAWGVLELVQLTVQEPLEGVSLLVSDPAFVVLVEVVPGVLEVLSKERWNLAWRQLVGSLEDHSGGELGLILHEELLAGLVAGRSETLLGVSGVDVVHDLILVGTVVAGDSHVLPGSLVDVSAKWVGVVGNSDGLGESEENSDSCNLGELHNFFN